MSRKSFMIALGIIAALFIALAVRIMVWTAAAALMLLAAAVLIRNCKAERQRNA